MTLSADFRLDLGLTNGIRKAVQTHEVCVRGI